MCFSVPSSNRAAMTKPRNALRFSLVSGSGFQAAEGCELLQEVLY